MAEALSFRYFSWNQATSSLSHDPHGRHEPFPASVIDLGAAA
jgi:hypothetical protein